MAHFTHKRKKKTSDEDFIGHKFKCVYQKMWRLSKQPRWLNHDQIGRSNHNKRR